MSQLPGVKISISFEEKKVLPKILPQLFLFLFLNKIVLGFSNSTFVVAVPIFIEFHGIPILGVLVLLILLITMLTMNMLTRVQGMIVMLVQY